MLLLMVMPSAGTEVAVQSMGGVGGRMLIVGKGIVWAVLGGVLRG